MVLDTLPGTILAPMPLWVPGRFYGHSWQTLLGTQGGSDGFLWLVPIFVPNQPGIAMASIGVESVTAAQAGSLARLGIYRDDGGLPGQLLKDFGTCAIDVTATFASIVTTQFLHQGLYWIAIAKFIAGATNGALRTVAGALAVGPWRGSMTPAGSAADVGLLSLFSDETWVLNGLPSKPPAYTTAGVAPHCLIGV